MLANFTPLAILAPLSIFDQASLVAKILAAGK
jgi:hypothetical protein